MDYLGKAHRVEISGSRCSRSNPTSNLPSRACKKPASKFSAPGFVHIHPQCCCSPLIYTLQGFNAINGSELAGAKQSGLTYYQVWNSSEWKLNEGKQGLQRLDKVIETAGKYGIKVILTFTNNWVGYGVRPGYCLSHLGQEC